MKYVIGLICSCLIVFASCESTRPVNKVIAPSTAAVKNDVAKASTSVSGAKSASQQSSKHIAKFKTKAQQIDDKAIKALKLL